MLTKELKAKLLNGEIIAQLKLQGAKLAKLSAIYAKATKAHHEAHERAVNFYYKTGAEFEQWKAEKGENFPNGFGEKSDELFKLSSDAEKVEKVARHNRDNYKKYIVYNIAYLFGNYWWELIERKGWQTLGETIGEILGVRLSIVQDWGGSICATPENSYVYYYVYIDGLAFWFSFNGARGSAQYDKPIYKELTIAKYLKIEKETNTKLNKIKNDLDALFITLDGEQVRDLLGEFDFKRELHKIGR